MYRTVIKSFSSFRLSALVFSFLAVGMVMPARSAEPTSQPSTQPTITKFADSKIWNDLTQNPAAFADPQKAKLLHARLAALDQEMAADAETTRGINRGVYLMATGDTELLAATEAMAASSDRHVAAIGKLRLLGVQWVTAADDANQLKVVDQLSEYFKTVDQDDGPFNTTLVGFFFHLVSPDHTSDVVKQRLDDAVEQLCPRSAVAIYLQQEKVMTATVNALTNAPMLVTGTTAEGKPFTTADWKGKVILVDFWATWCVPCKATLPHVKEIYQKYHSQGLEIVGVSNDYTKDALLKYVAADPELAWPDLFDQIAADDHEWNSLSKKYGVESIPRMFLIDRNGICRTIEARETMDEMIPKLLAEPAPVSMAK